jgi:NAD(P)-dependent dehydrogenase (short-subunit alcohol dehydrogenase family)
MNPKIWLITGISSGLGKALAQSAIEKGHFVMGTFRHQAQVDVFNEQHKQKAFALKLDLTRRDDIRAVVQQVKGQFGRLDVLVNNAGFGFAGAIEEANDREIRAVFEANFFGTLQMTQAALPMLRAQKSGHIIQISSHGGIKAFPGFGIYNASKFALEGFSEALAAEVEPLGIKVTIVEPGPFRTGFANTAFQEAENRIEDYHLTAGAFRERMKLMDGKQEGDPEKAADAILQITSLAQPPLRLPLGKVAIGTITSKLESVKKDLNEWKTVAESAIFD